MATVIVPRVVLLAFAATAATAATGCATFTDNDVVAPVGGDELSSDEFAVRSESLLAAQGASGGPDVDSERVDGEVARSTVANWIALQFAEDAGVLDQYRGGVEAVGVACVFVLQTPDEAAAQALVDELGAGASWDDVVAREVAGAAAGGRQQCVPLDGLTPDIAEQIAGLSPDDPYRVVSGVPSLVVRAQSVDELLGIDLLTALQTSQPELVESLVADAGDSDVYVDPRIGAFDPVRFAVDPVS